MYCNVSFETLQSVVLTGASHPLFATTLATQLHLPLVPIQSTLFADGTHDFKIAQSIKNNHVLVVQSVAPPIHDSFLELLFLADNARRHGAKKITTICPFLGFRRDNANLALSVRLLKTAGVDHVVVMDMHSIESEKIFTQAGIQYTEISALPLFIKQIKQQSPKNTLVVTPDVGSRQRLHIYTEGIDIPLLNIQKIRIPNTTDRVFFKKIHHSLDGKNILIIDDEINTGATIVGAAKILKQAGANTISVYATHGIFSGNALKKIQHSPISQCIITDTIPQKTDLKLKIISVVDLFAQALHRQIGIFE
jgi:ribose-phosphate pyrophosphokinase